MQAAAEPTWAAVSHLSLTGEAPFDKRSAEDAFFVARDAAHRRLARACARAIRAGVLDTDSHSSDAAADEVLASFVELWRSGATRAGSSSLPESGGGSCAHSSGTSQWRPRRTFASFLRVFSDLYGASLGLVAGPLGVTTPAPLLITYFFLSRIAAVM